MASSGRQLAEQNLVTFTTWLGSKSDDDFRQLASRGVLSRKEIAIECGFSKSALDQNPRIKAALRAAEADLRERGILPAMADRDLTKPSEPVMREVGTQKSMIETERLRRLEQENASLKAENGELKKKLEQFAIIREALAMTGRVPR